MDNLGTVVADEQVYRITQISLRDGAVWFQTTREVTGHERGEIREYTVFGPDGVLVARSGLNWRPVKLPRAYPGDRINIALRWDITGKATV